MGARVADQASPTVQVAGPSAPASVTVIVPTRDRGNLITETLDALLRLGCPKMEILVVDQSADGVTRQTVCEVARGDRRVRYHHSRTVGLSVNRNIGAQLSRADVVAYTDDDCIVTDGWLHAILEEFRQPDVAAVYGRLLPYRQARRTGRDVGLKDSTRRAEYTTKVPPWHIGHGGNMAFRRADLLEVGAFDPLLGAGGPLCSNEDGDIAYRLLASGKRIVYSPEALAYHKHWKAWKAQQAMERAYGVGAGAQFAKYVRCGDRYGLRLLLTWVWQLGVRRLGAGLLKWRSAKVMYLGYCQLAYPWLGIWRSRRYAVDCRTMTYALPGEDPAARFSGV